MSEYEYRVIPAPTKGVKAKGKRSAEDRFCNALEIRMNEMAADGWEYHRADILPSVERAGLTSTKTKWHNLLVFRRQKPLPAKDTPGDLPSLLARDTAARPETAQPGTSDEAVTLGSDDKADGGAEAASPQTIQAPGMTPGGKRP
jgi:hypothetical protein